MSSHRNNSVLRISSSYVAFDWTQPYNKHNTSESTGTGFVMDKISELNTVDDENSFSLLTAYHVVDNAKQILVRIESLNGSEIIPSKLIACNPDLDVAILQVPTKLPDDIHPLQCGDSDAVSPLDDVQALGYALGKTHLNYTTGVVSGRTPSKIQVDAAINGGNSGGPVLNAKTGLVIGVVVSGYNNAQNMNFACPIKEAYDSLSRIVREKKMYELLPVINARFVTTSTSLTKIFGLQNGCMCTYIHEKSDAYNQGVRKGHILTKINDYDVQYDGTIRPPFWENPLSYKSIIHRGAIGDEMKLEFFDTDSKTLRSISTQLESNKNVFREMWPEFENIRYCVRGGIVVQPLVANLANHEVNKVLHWKFTNMMNNSEIKVQSVAIVTHLQSNCPFKKTPGTLTVGDVILGINDIYVNKAGEIDPFEQYINAWDKLQNDEIITLYMRDGTIASATKSDIVKCENEIQKELHIDLVNS
jgi:S1-C subfamily serine protease